MIFRLSRPVVIVGALLFAAIFLPVRPSLAQDVAPPEFPGYSSLERLQERWQAAEAHPNVTLIEYGATKTGVPLQALKIAKDAERTLPAVLIVGSIDPDDLLGAELTTRVVERWVQAFADSDQRPIWNEILDRAQFYVIPCPAPTAYAKNFRFPVQGSTGNLTKTDDDRDGRFGEDPTQDLDGDGWITQLRVEDLAGEWMPHPQEPRVLVKGDRTKEERPNYRVTTEGFDDDRDDAWNEDGSGGVSLNRNFPQEYAYFTPHAGEYPTSERETAALADFVYDRPEILAIFTVSDDDNLFEPWKPNGDKEKERIKSVVLEADVKPLDRIAERYREIHGGKSPPSPEKTPGSFVRFAYFQLGRWSLSSRTWWVPPLDEEAAKEIKDDRESYRVRAMRWLEANQIPGFAPWKRVEIPNSNGQVAEAGGLREFYLWHPPEGELDGLAQKHLDWFQELPASFPKLEVTSVQSESLDAGIYRLTIRVANTGKLPTMTAMGEINGRPMPLNYDLTLPKGVRLLKGHPRGRWERLQGYDGSAQQEWLVRVPDGTPTTFAFVVGSPAVGTVQVEGDLNGK